MKKLKILIYAFPLLCVGCFMPTRNMITDEGPFKEIEVLRDFTTYPKPVDGWVLHSFKLMCKGHPIYSAKVTLKHANLMTRDNVRLAATNNGTYDFWVPQDAPFELEISGGVEGDISFPTQTIETSIRKIAGKKVSTLEIDGRIFDGLYYRNAWLNTSTTPPRKVNLTSPIRNRFVVFTTNDLRTMVYDRSLKGTWYYPEPKSRSYDEAVRLAARHNGEIPSLAHLVNLFSESADYNNIHLHPILARQLKGSTLWIAGGKRVLSINERYAPYANADHEGATTLIFIPGSLEKYE